jgi:hypothetical protein
MIINNSLHEENQELGIQRYHQVSDLKIKKIHSLAPQRTGERIVPKATPILLAKYGPSPDS